ncbi:MAG: hypothetical protein DME00_07415 [Candidatus Rokuibacteriota bacterium]|nr:MAG: hypothetical protein DME00_07415 [Candidatus Rokubacteria bacterium]PYO04525.1 MAG: hypothetical protein DMD75_31160 [Candidatus Rokubacteria bacterium]
MRRGCECARLTSPSSSSSGRPCHEHSERPHGRVQSVSPSRVFRTILAYCVARLRRKRVDADGSSSVITTVHGVGYRFPEREEE